MTPIGSVISGFSASQLFRNKVIMSRRLPVMGLLGLWARSELCPPSADGSMKRIYLKLKSQNKGEFKLRRNLLMRTSSLLILHFHQAGAQALAPT